MTHARMIFAAALMAVTLSLFWSLNPAPVAAAGDALSPEQRREVEEIVRDFIKKNPEFVLDSLRQMRERTKADERRQAVQALASLRGEIENDPTSPVGGNPRGDVTLVEFFDYRCGFCKRVFPNLKKLIEEDGNIRYVFKEFPILGPLSVFASKAALAAWSMDEEKYLRFHDAMMSAKGSLTEQKTLQLAAQSGLDVKALRRAMDDPEIEKILQKNFALAKALNINGTPAFVIGDELVPGAIDLDTLRSLVAKARNS
jgi:protein-disulfide isomerase